jgi:KipI family sensor histidine kinase inhibitor
LCGTETKNVVAGHLLFVASVFLRFAVWRRNRRRDASATKCRVLYTFLKMISPMTEGAQFQVASDQSLLVRFGHRITLDANQRVRKLLHLLESEPIEGVRNLHPAYCSLLVNFDVLKLSHDRLEVILRRYVNRLEALSLAEPRHLDIPVCYGGEFGPDLSDVATLHSMTPDQVIELHSSVTYAVYFLGFVPGYPYLGELPPALATPRLATPRERVPPGSIAIGGSQTGVYPLATPGGWRLIGRTPVAMFRPDRDNMSLLSIGDRVRFVPISSAQFAASEKG